MRPEPLLLEPAGLSLWDFSPTDGPELLSSSLPAFGSLRISLLSDFLVSLDSTGLLCSPADLRAVLPVPAGLLSSFVEVESIKRHFKSRLVGTVLNGYLCLRKLVLQRTKLIDETQDMLLEMLEDMTTGNPGMRINVVS